jgi:protein-S-isoprenylcysteine O-methyltransferase Ste14
MTPDALRLVFVAGYAVSILVLVVRVLPTAARVDGVSLRATGPVRWLPFVLLPIGFVVPPALLLGRVGEIRAAWWPVRALGIACALYAATMLLGSAATLGDLLVPQAVVRRDHALVTSGPYRLVRHPAYSGDLALWLGAGFATLNVALLVGFPFYAWGARAQARVEERLLTERFGPAYDAYAARVGRFLPRLTASPVGS